MNSLNNLKKANFKFNDYMYRIDAFKNGLLYSIGRNHIQNTVKILIVQDDLPNLWMKGNSMQEDAAIRLKVYCSPFNDMRINGILHDVKCRTPYKYKVWM